MRHKLTLNDGTFIWKLTGSELSEKDTHVSLKLDCVYESPEDMPGNPFIRLPGETVQIDKRLITNTEILSPLNQQIA